MNRIELIRAWQDYENRYQISEAEFNRIADAAVDAEDAETIWADQHWWTDDAAGTPKITVASTSDERHAARDRAIEAGGVFANEGECGKEILPCGLCDECIENGLYETD